MSYFYALGVAPPPNPAPVSRGRGGGGTHFPRYLNRTLLNSSLQRTQVPPPVSSWFRLPNNYDACLGRDFQLYRTIDRTLLCCGKKPECFLIDERAWVEQPPGGIAFNPSAAIPLPAPATPETVILSLRCPFGYDGVVLAQYHDYTQTFDEGSGDLAWRVRVNGRYLRDMGNMLSSIGTPRQLSPCPGGLWVHSGNLIEYIVSAPNTGGSLPPAGTGNILAGLHGWFFPRK